MVVREEDKVAELIKEVGELVLHFCECYKLMVLKISSKQGRLRKMIGVVAAKDLLAEPSEEEFTPYDKFCPFYKSVWMMRNIIHFYNLGNQAVERGADTDGQKITYTLIKHRLGDLFYRLVSQKFEDPTEGESALVAKFTQLHEDLTNGFRNLEDEAR